MSALVTAIIPAYNYGRFIRRAIDSVLAQTHAPIECIVIDDGSTDDTLSVLRTYDRQIITVAQERRGVSAARNAGLRLAQGEYIAFLDGDDRWHPSKIQEQVALLAARPDLGCVGCGLEHIYPNGVIERVSGEPNQRDRRDTFRRMARRKFWIGGSGSGAVVRKALLQEVGGFDETLAAAEDWDLWLRLAMHTNVSNVETVLLSVYRHGTGTFRNATLMETNQWRVYSKAIAAWPGALSSADRRQIRALILADAARESTATRAKFVYLLKSLFNWPFRGRNIKDALSAGIRAAVPGLKSHAPTDMSASRAAQ